MSFMDLITRAAAALKPKPAKTAKIPAKEKKSKAAGTETPARSKTS